MKKDDVQQGIQKRDEETYALLMREYTPLLWVVASGYLPRESGFSPEDIEEIISDVFFQLWEKPERYHHEKSSIKNYLCTLAKHKAISLYRKRKKGEVIYLDDTVGETISEDTCPVTEELDYSALYEAIKALPEPTREILVRRYFYEEKPLAIADKTRLPKKEVENRLYRGKQALQKLLGNKREVN